MGSIKSTPRSEISLHMDLKKNKKTKETQDCVLFKVFLVLL